MKIRKKILFFTTLVLLIFIITSGAVISYYYRHPDLLLPFVQKYVSNATGLSLSFEDLSFSINPLQITARGITLKPENTPEDFQLKIMKLDAIVTPEGTFGGKSLVFRNLGVTGFSFFISEKWTIPEISGKTEEPSFLSGIIKNLLALLLFRDIKLEDLHLSEGNIFVSGDKNIEISEIKADLDARHYLEISCKALFNWESRNINFRMPQLNMFTASAISLINPEIKGTISVKDATITGTDLDIRNINLGSEVVYNHNQKKISSKRMFIEFQDLLLSQNTKGIIEHPGYKLRMGDSKATSNLVYDHIKKTVTLSPFQVNLQTIELKENTGDEDPVDEQTPPHFTILDLRTDSAIHYNHISRDVRFEPLVVNCGGIDIKGRSGENAFLRDLLLNTNAGLSLNKKTIDISGFSLAVGDILNASGKFNARLQPEKNIVLNLDQCTFVPDKMTNLLPRTIRNKLSPFNLSGPINVKGDIGITGEEEVGIQLDLKVTLDDNRYGISYDNLTLEGVSFGEIMIQGITPDINIAAWLKTEKTLFKGMGISPDPFEMSLSISGEYPVFEIPEIKSQIPGISITAGGKVFSANTVSIEGRDIRLDKEKNQFLFPEIKIDSSLIKNLNLGFELKDNEKKIRIMGNNSDLINSAIELNLIPSGWNMTGSDTLKIEAQSKGKDECSFSADFIFNDLGIENSVSGFIGDGLELKSSIKGTIDLNESVIRARMDTAAGKGEILYDRYYFNLLNNPVSTSSDFQYDFSRNDLELSGLNLILRDLFSMNLSGNLNFHAENKGLRLNLRFPDTAIGPLFKNFISDPFKAEKPLLKELDLEGHISAEFEVSNLNNIWEAKGRLKLENTGMLMADRGYALNGITLDLPFWYLSENTSDESYLNGSFSIKSMSIPLLADQSLSAAIRVVPNHIEITPYTDLQIKGGKIGLGKVTGSEIFSMNPSFKTRIELKNIRIEPLLSDLIPQHLGGNLNGDLDPVILSKGKVTSKGEIIATPFAGEVIISDPGITGLFSSLPMINFDAGWRDLDLEQITSGTSFGLIQGLLGGYLKDFQFASGQPQRFDLLMETVPKKGISQKISVKAIDNIARIGGGHTPFMGLAGSFASIFKEFPYKMIGIHASLENDVFRVNGTIKEDDLEYIIKRSGFSGVNVVNQNPDNRISFKDMLKRIKRVTSSEGGPVIR